MNPSLQNILLGVAGAGVTGLVAWLGLFGRKAIKNLGKTKLEIALEEQAEANKRLEAALKTADPTDDRAALLLIEAAKRHVDTAKLIKGITDAAGDAEVKASE